MTRKRKAGPSCAEQYSAAAKVAVANNEVMDLVHQAVIEAVASTTVSDSDTSLLWWVLKKMRENRAALAGQKQEKDEGDYFGRGGW